MDAQEIDSSLGEELSELVADAGDDVEAVSETVESQEPSIGPACGKKRGRKAIPAKWTPVMSLDLDDPLKMSIRELAPDMQLAQAERRVPNTRREREWAPIFCPRKFVTDQEATDPEKFRLSQKQLESYGATISKLRRGFEKEAMKTAEERGYDIQGMYQEVKVIAKIIRKRGTPRDEVKQQLAQPDFDEHVPIGSRKKGRRRSVLSVDEKICIVHKVLISFEHQREVAKEYRISPNSVAQIVHKAKKKPKFIRELWNRKAEKEEKVEAAINCIGELISDRVKLDSAGTVMDKLHEKTDKEYKVHQVRSILGKQMGMSYKKLSSVSLHTNSPKNLILR